MTFCIGRREFITLLGSAAAAWPLPLSAQQSERVRRIGVLLPAGANDPRLQTFLAAFHQGLALLGWTVGRNVRFLHVLANFSVPCGPASIDAATRTVPIVFPAIGDPVGAGFLDSLARPGGNATGFMSYEYSLSGKWLELLKQIAPGVTRVAVLRDAAVSIGPVQFGVIQAVAPALRVDVNPINIRRDAGEIERAIAAFAGSPNGGLILTAGATAQLHSHLIITLAARHKLPAIYQYREFAAAGGLISYGADYTDQYRRAAGYVDRILKGEKPADLPVQAPTRYDLVINLKTAKALGLEVPPTLLARADEVIE
jgi:putative ABC transport system substrate-binding protein